MQARFLLPLIRGFGLVLLTFLGPYRWRGAIPRRGGVLILANHTSDIDPILVQGATSRQVFFMAKEELFRMGLLGSVIRWFRAFPVKRGAPDRAAIRHAVKLLQAGEAVCVFPEGKLSPTGKLQPILPGVALIARMAGCPIVCVGIKNATGIMPYGKVIPRPAWSWVSVSIGSPWTEYDDFESLVRQELLHLSGADQGY